MLNITTICLVLALGLADSRSGDPFPDCEVPCPADISGNGDVDVNDILDLLECWGELEPGSSCYRADFYPDAAGNGVVDVNEVLEMLSAWGPCPEPEGETYDPHCVEHVLGGYIGGYNDYYYYDGIRVFGDESRWVSPMALASLLGVGVVICARRWQH
ncbi:MAG: hypothetical protein MK116_09920 [Phycisphaerales bacterium]|nr:hypothetical protein [Phycisphaerales bacterium]